LHFAKYSLYPKLLEYFEWNTNIKESIEFVKMPN
jgi:hypothetical protein